MSFYEIFKRVDKVEFTEIQNQPAVKKNERKYVQDESGAITHLLIKGEIDYELLNDVELVSSLECLVLQDTVVSEFPLDISKFKNLQYLDLDNCGLSEFPEECKMVEGLTGLSLNHNQFTEIPKEVFSFKQLDNLQFNYNKLTHIPKEIGELVKLSMLLISGNELQDLPQELSACSSSLVSLAVSSNNLTGIPKVLGFLKNLQQLEIANNNIEVISKELAEMTNLKFLMFGGNKIRTIPDFLHKLEHLEGIWFDSNNINRLPDFDLLPKNVTYLSLAKNEISSIPESYRDCEILHIELDKNPITDKLDEISRTLISKELIDYLLEVQKPETKPLNEAKILVVGDERVGKTSLINRLVGREMNLDEESTLGIDIQNHPLPNGLSVNFWDFAGQEITHQTHQFFLSSRSLYLFVIDAQKEDNDSGLFHWLNTIKAGAENSPIIVVVNKRDLNLGYRFDINRYKEEFNIVDVLYVTTKEEGKNGCHEVAGVENDIEELISAIQHQISQINDVELPFPPSWLAVKRHIEEIQKSADFIESSEYEKICEEQGITSTSLQDSLLSILNQIGTIVTYKNHDRLRVMQIINPEWVTNGVYKIIRSPLINETAKLTKAQFKQIFVKEKGYEKARHYTWLVDLLKQFQIAFDVDNHDTILIPSKLISTQPDFNLKQFQKGLNFRFQYKGVLKKSVMHQFIVHLHEYVTEQELKYWQRGVFLSYQNANAVVISDEDKKTITIAIDSSDRAGRELLTIIRHGIRKVNGLSFNAEEQIPLMLEDNKSELQIVGYESYSLIIDAEKEGDSSIRFSVVVPWDKSKTSHRFSISEILDGYRMSESIQFDYEKLVEDLYTIACLETENRNAIFKETEDSTNDRFRTALIHKGYFIADQSRGGDSQSGKSSGERDIVIRNIHTGITECIVEALQLKTFNKENIELHVNKLVDRYDTVGNRQNFVVNYVKSKDFLGLWNKYQELIPDFEELVDEKFEKENVKIGRSYIGTSNSNKLATKRQIIHFFINFHSKAK